MKQITILFLAFLLGACSVGISATGSKNGVGLGVGVGGNGISLGTGIKL